MYDLDLIKAACIISKRLDENIIVLSEVKNFTESEDNRKYRYDLVYVNQNNTIDLIYRYPDYNFINNKEVVKHATFLKKWLLEEIVLISN